MTEIYGQLVKAGIGSSMVIATIDFETYSEAGFIWDESLNKWTAPINSNKKGLPAVGVAVYTEHPTAEVLSCAYDLKDGKGPRLWIPGQLPPFDLFNHIHKGGLLEAHNVNFERWVWANICCKKYAWPKIKIEQWRDSAAKASAFALPRSLDPCGEVLNIEHKKDKEGTRLINKFCIPRNPTLKNSSLRTKPQDDLEDAQNLYKYNLRDILAQSEISRLIPDLNEFEQQFWFIDQKINERGIAIDLPLIQSCIKIIEQAYEKYNNRLYEITKGEVSKASEIAKLRQWLEVTHNIKVSVLDEETVTKLLQKVIHPEVYEVLKIRELTAFASVKKLYAMINQVSQSGRLHDLFIYHSARTGRAAGSGAQPQNLPNSGPDRFYCNVCSFYSFTHSYCSYCDEDSNNLVPISWNSDCIDQAIGVLRNGDLGLTEYLEGNALETISGCLRSMFIASPGKDLICSDYSAIEGLVLAAIAGEEWRLEVFRTHGKLYETSASKITGKTIETYIDYKNKTGNHHSDRKIGKVAELASGYGGWINAWKAFGADSFMTDEEIKKAILAWRKSSPKIVEFWGGQQRNWFPEYYGLEGAAIQAVMNPNQEFKINGLTWVCVDNVLYCRLLSGRYLAYHRPKLEPSYKQNGTYSLSFYGWNTNPSQGAIGWIKMYTYGGKLTENIIQATARDILAHAIVNLEQAGYPIVLHVHDEIVAEVPENWGSIQEFEKIMSTMPAWAHNWPLKASGGWREKRYGK